MNHPAKSCFCLQPHLGRASPARPFPRVFYNNEIHGDLLRGDEELDTFAEVATCSPEYQ